MFQMKHPCFKIELYTNLIEDRVFNLAQRVIIYVCCIKKVMLISIPVNKKEISFNFKNLNYKVKYKLCFRFLSLCLASSKFLHQSSE